MKTIFKKAAALLLAVGMLVPGLALANPADNLNSHPGPDALGSITVNVRIVDEILPGGLTPPVTVGVPVEDVPVQIEQVSLNPGVAAPTQQQLQDPDWIAANTSPIAGTQQTASTNAQGVVVFNNLPQAIWRVSQLGTNNPVPVADRFTPFLVGIPTHMADGTYRLDVEVWPKIEREPLTGGSKEALEHFDNIITWEFGIDIPGSIAMAQNFYLLDTLDPRLEFIPGSVAGRFTPVTGTGYRPLQAAHFRVVEHNVNGTDVIRIELTQTGMAYIAQHGDLVDGRLYFTMETALNVEGNADLGEIRNDAVWRFNPEEPWCPEDDPNWPDCDELPPVCPEDDPDCEEITTTLTTYGLNILKLSVADRQVLQGAQFSIYREVAEGTIGASTYTINGVTRHVLPLRNGDGTAMTETTNANGILQFNGLNSTNQTFWLRETAAPTGFRVIDEWMQVNVTQAHTNNPLRDSDNRIPTPVNAQGYVVPVNVYNERQGAWTLPETGGVGTIIITVAGIALLGGALVLFVGNKKEEEDVA